MFQPFRDWFGNRTLTSKVVLLNLVVLVPAVTLLITYLLRTTRENTIAQSVDAASRTIHQYTTLRGYYTEKVVAKVRKHSKLSVSFDHDTQAETIPLPATMIQDLGQAFAKQDLKVQLKLYSHFPFPHRQSRVLDPFAKRAIQALEKTPDQTFVQVENVEGKTTVRVAVADRLVNDSCVNCHNTHPDSPKTDWKLGDVRGVLEVDTPIDEALAENAATTFTASVIVVVSALLILALTALLMSFIGGKLRRTVSAVAAVGRGDLTQRIEVTSKDEVGQMIDEVNRMIARLHDVILRMHGASGQLVNTARQATQTAEDQEQAMKNLGHSTAEVAQAVHRISAASGQLAGTMNDVNDRANQAASLATTGRSWLDNMQKTMSHLVEATSSISDKLGLIHEKADNINMVVTTITKVADQTNLLSINAAIEAEKAGDNGRGFLVVAREIRRLADQTAVATLDIEAIVQEMHSAITSGTMQMDEFNRDVRESATTVADIGRHTAQIIEEVHNLSGRFHEVNASMRDQSEGAKQINEAIGHASGQMIDVMNTVNRTTSMLKQSVEILHHEMEHFTV